MELIKELPEVFEEFAEQRQKSFIKTFYGQSFLADICELDKEMLLHFLKTF